VIRVLDKEWTSEQVAAQTAIAVAEEYGPADQWQATSPWNGPVSLAAWLTVLFTSECGDPRAARLMVHSMTVDEFVGCLSEPSDG
jgi:hypothetical protein